MSIYSRQYMRSDYHPSGRSFNALKVILVSLVVVFLFQMIANVWLGTGVIEEYFGLSVRNLKHGLVYTLLTYGYLHQASSLFPMHLLLNGLVLFFVGRFLQRQLGEGRLFEFFHLCVLAGGIAWTALAILRPNQISVIGASGAAYGFVALYALFTWNEVTRLMVYFFIPVAIRGRTIFYIILGMQGFFFLFNEVPQNVGDMTAYSAHLGGIGMAWIYHRYLLGRPSLWSLLQPSRRSRQAPAWQKRGNAAKSSAGRFQLNLRGNAKGKSGSAKPGLRAEVDRILDKINSKGFGSLTEAEKRTLDRAKDELN